MPRAVPTVASCSIAAGHYSEPHLPNFRGEDAFPGLVMHSHNYRHPGRFKGQTGECSVDVYWSAMGRMVQCEGVEGGLQGTGHSATDSAGSYFAANEPGMLPLSLLHCSVICSRLLSFLVMASVLHHVMRSGACGRIGQWYGHCRGDCWSGREVRRAGWVLRPEAGLLPVVSLHAHGWNRI